MKLRPLVTASILLIALQSCSLTGNNASSGRTSSVVVADSTAYLLDCQKDTSNCLVSLTNYLQASVFDFRYATAQNFIGRVLYDRPQGYLRLPAAKALRQVEEALRSNNLGLKIFDAYRPYSVTVEMWKLVPDERYAANPAKGSGHNRGIAVDLTLIDLRTGKELRMPTAFDDFTEKAHHNYMQLPDDVVANRKLLRNTMEKHGFVALETEWWHYYLPDGKKYSLLDLDFEQLRRLVK